MFYQRNIFVSSKCDIFVGALPRSQANVACHLIFYLCRRINCAGKFFFLIYFLQYFAGAIKFFTNTFFYNVFARVLFAPGIVLFFFFFDHILVSLGLCGILISIGLYQLY